MKSRLGILKLGNPVVILGPVLLEAGSLLEVGCQLLRLLRLDVELATSRAVRCLLRLAKPSKTPRSLCSVLTNPHTMQSTC